MSLHIIIDGYNLIRQSPSLSLIDTNSLEAGREALIERLSRYKRFKDHSITIVFDGTNAQSFGGARNRYKGIDIVFSYRGELADNVIKRIVSQEGSRAVVVTSDKEVADYAVLHGAATIDSVEFEYKMQSAWALEAMPDYTKDEDRSWKPTTRKKGPARRCSKKERRSRSRTKKL